jgi:hypothetical protein
MKVTIRFEDGNSILVQKEKDGQTITIAVWRGDKNRFVLSLPDYQNFPSLSSLLRVFSPGASKVLHEAIDQIWKDSSTSPLTCFHNIKSLSSLQRHEQLPKTSA